MENINQYKLISKKSDGVYSASLLDEQQIEYINTNEVGNYKFGGRIEDIIEVSIFDAITQDLIAWVPLTGSYLSTQKIQSSYINLSGELIDNSYQSSVTDFFILKDNEQTSVIFDPISDLELFGLTPESPYIIGYWPMSNRVGNYERPISIKSISPSRTEIRLNYGEITDELTVTEFQNFLKTRFFIGTVSGDLLSKIESFKVEELFYTSKTDRSYAVAQLKHFYGLKRDIDVINLIEKINKGIGPFSILYQFKNWIYDFYTDIISESELLKRYDDISTYLIGEKYLPNNFNNPTAYDAIYNFVKDILDSIYITSIKTTLSEYNRLRLEPLKTLLNFGQNKIYHILNLKTVNDDIIIKIESPLKDDISEGEHCYISRLIVDPHFVDCSTYDIKTTEIIELRPSDWSTFNFNNYTDNSLQGLSLDQENRINNGANELAVEKLPIDYTIFENFVQFSSAQYRLDAFSNKKDRIDDLTFDNELLYQTGDFYAIQEVSGNLKTISKIKNSFDGYESFLYNNNEWFVQHSEDYSGSNSASRYDVVNPNSLQNNLPSYVMEESDNLDFVKFVNVIGHTFDELFSHVHQFNQSKFPTNFGSDQMFDGAVNKMLVSLGWDSSYTTNDVFLELFGEDKYGNIIESKSGGERKKIIWSRFVNALPYILKTKGTDECLRILFSVYGIPKSLYKIREFNSIPNNSTSRKNDFSFDNDYYALHYSGSSEYIQTDWSSEVQSVEFKFSFDTEKLHPDGSIFRLISLGDNWLIGVLRDGLDTIKGKVFFTLAEDPSDPNSIKTIILDSQPLFDGNIYSVLLKKNDVEFDSDNTNFADVNVELIPRRFELISQRSEGNRISIFSSASFVFNVDSCNSFMGSNYTSSDAFVYIGNYDQVVTSSIAPDIDSFYGVIDEIKYYKTPISSERFNAHTKYVDAFDINDSSELESSLLLHLNFESPVDLFYGSTSQSLSLGYYPLTNNAFSSSLTDIRAYNFPALTGYETLGFPENQCVEYPEVVYNISASFPWHFKSFRTKEHISVPNFGSAQFNNEKIYFSSGSISEYLYTDFSVGHVNKEIGSSSPILGIFFSPSDQLNLEILQFFGDINIGDYIGDPSDLYKQTYSGFESFRRRFFKHFKGVGFNEYIKILKQYVDSSIFKNMKKTIPVRSKVKTGILIEPSILERNKIRQRPLRVENGEIINFRVDAKPVVSAQNLSVNSLEDTVSLNIGFSDSIAYFNNLDRNYVSDKSDNCIVSKGGVVIRRNKRYFAQTYNTTQKVFSLREDGTEVYSEKQIKKLNLTPLWKDENPITIASVLADSDSKFGIGNYQTFLGNCPRRRPRWRRRIGSLSVQTVETTLADPPLDAVSIPQIENAFPPQPEVYIKYPPLIEFGQSSTIEPLIIVGDSLVESSSLTPIEPVVDDQFPVETPTLVVPINAPVVSPIPTGISITNLNNRNYTYQRTVTVSPWKISVKGTTTNNNSNPFGTTITDPTSIVVIGNADEFRIDDKNQE